MLTKLFASTTGSDADFVVKLIDVYPEKYEPNPKLGGYQLMVSNEVFRGRFRKSFEKPEAMAPNKVEEVAIDLHTQSYRFKKGHRIMVQMQSSWFPLIDRNPQTFVPNIFEAKSSDFRVDDPEDLPLANAGVVHLVAGRANEGRAVVVILSRQAKDPALT